jgi:hypothetical protein
MHYARSCRMERIGWLHVSFPVSLQCFNDDIWADIAAIPKTVD